MNGTRHNRRRLPVGAGLSIALGAAVALASLPRFVAAEPAAPAAKKAAKAPAKAPAKSKRKAAAKFDPAQVTSSFTDFCSSWMEKLVARETHNTGHIEWRTNGAVVEGDYVGYSKEHTCNVTHTEVNEVPIGKVVYREMKYHKSGGTQEAAATSTPEVVEVTEVTEIFRYDKGKWEY